MGGVGFGVIFTIGVIIIIVVLCIEIIVCVCCVILLKCDCSEIFMGALWPAVGAVHRRAFQDGASGIGVAAVGGQWPILGVQTFGLAGPVGPARTGGLSLSLSVM